VPVRLRHGGSGKRSPGSFCNEKQLVFSRTPSQKRQETVLSFEQLRLQKAMERCQANNEDTERKKKKREFD